MEEDEFFDTVENEESKNDNVFKSSHNSQVKKDFEHSVKKIAKVEEETENNEKDSQNKLCEEQENNINISDSEETFISISDKEKENSKTKTSDFSLNVGRLCDDSEPETLPKHSQSNTDPKKKKVHNPNDFGNENTKQTPINKLGTEKGSQENNASLISWSNVWGALNQVKESTISHLDKLTESIQMKDSEVSTMGTSAGQETEQFDSKHSAESPSFKSLFDNISPTGSFNVNRTNSVGSDMASSSGWVSKIDKGFDAASETVGNAIMGGMQTIERGIGVEFDVKQSPSTQIFDYENKNSDEIEESLTIDEIGKDSPPNKMIKDYYVRGLGTLEMIGKHTAGIMLSTQRQFSNSPMFNQQPNSIKSEQIKLPFKNLYSLARTDRIIEEIQCASIQASINLKKLLKKCKPTDLNSFKTIKINDFQVEEISFSDESNGKNVFEQAKFIFTDRWEPESDKKSRSEDKELQYSPLTSPIAAKSEMFYYTKQLESIVSAQLTNEQLEHWRLAVDTPFPPDTTTLLLFLLRMHHLQIYTLTLLILFSLEYRSVEEWSFMCNFGFNITSQSLLYFRNFYPLDDKLVEEQKNILNHCREELLDIFESMQPLVKLNMFKLISNCTN